MPESKQQEIAEIVEIIKEEAKPEKIILFGSHASDKWVEDEYVEDGGRKRKKHMDILIFGFLMVENF